VGEPLQIFERTVYKRTTYSVRRRLLEVIIPFSAFLVGIEFNPPCCNSVNGRVNLVDVWLMYVSRLLMFCWQTNTKVQCKK
jgi:hypothetical protein